MGGIAHQRHTAEGPLRQRIAIDHRVFQNLFGVADHLRYIQPVEMPVGVGRQKILQLAAQVPVLDDIARRLNLRHPVDQLQAIGLDMLADGIDHHLAHRQPADLHHAHAAEIGLPACHATPHVDALIGHATFVGVELFADSRMNTVTGNRHRAARGAAIGKARRHALIILIDAFATLVQQNAVLSQSLPHGVDQYLMQVAAMDRQLRPVIAGGTAAWLLADELTEAVVVGHFLGGDCDILQRLTDAQLGQLAHGVRLQIDTHAKPTQIRCCLEHPARQAEFMQAERQHQTGDATAEDEDVVVTR